MNDVIQIVKTSLQGRDFDAVNGRLVCSMQQVADAPSALRRFVDFGGEGWLCVTTHQDILRFGPSQPLALSSDGAAWPLCGEAARGAVSLHLQRGATGWELTTIERLPAEGPDDVIVKGVMKARDGRGDLHYETAWRPVDVAGLVEMRPGAFRFVGSQSAKPEKEA